MNLDVFTRAYILCALWSSCDDTDRPLDDNYDAGDIAPESLVRIETECRKFQDENATDLENPAQDGHDFWLTRNGHGAGFWDRGYGERGERLTKAAHAAGSSYLYVGDDGQIHSETC